MHQILNQKHFSKTLRAISYSYSKKGCFIVLVPHGNLADLWGGSYLPTYLPTCDDSWSSDTDPLIAFIFTSIMTLRAAKNVDTSSCVGRRVRVRECTGCVLREFVFDIRYRCNVWFCLLVFLMGSSFSMSQCISLQIPKCWICEFVWA